MKRNVIWAALLVFLFASCKNENIEMQRKVSFTVDPSEVIGSFTYEADEGELESFNSNYKLRIHLLVYDKMGDLAAAEECYLSNYQGIMNSSLTLWDGEYTAVAITDVVKYDDGVTSTYWNINGTDCLSNLKVSDAGNDGEKHKILGISNYHFHAKEGADDHTIRVKPAGALILVKSSNIHYYSTVVRYKLGMNKGTDCYTFNSDGSYAVAAENGGENYEWHAGYFDPQDYNSTNDCHYYHFVMPLGRTAFQWLGKTEDNVWRYGGDKMSANIKIGEEYLIRFELGSSIQVQMDLVNGEKTID